MIDDADIAAVFLAELVDGDLILRLLAHDVDAVGAHRVLRRIFRHLRVHFRVRDGIDDVHQIADGIVVDFPAHLNVRRDFIAFGDGDVPHVIGEAAHLDLLGEGIARSHLAPGSELFQRFGIFVVADDDLVVHAQAGDDIAELSVAVGCLVLVHEVHVDGIVRQSLVVLRREMAHGLL